MLVKHKEYARRGLLELSRTAEEVVEALMKRQVVYHNLDLLFESNF